MKKKLLLFHPALAPYRIDFFNSIHEHFDTTFYFFNNNLLNQKFDTDRLKQKLNFECNYLNNGINLPGRFIRFGIIRIIKRHRPSIVICPEYNLINIFILIFRHFSKYKFKIFTICDDNLDLAKNAFLLRRISRYIILKSIDGVILTNKDVANWYKEILRPKSKLLIFPIIRDERIYHKEQLKSLSEVKYYSKHYNLKGKKLILFVGRLTKVKNLDRLILAFKTLHDSDEKTILILVGSGDQEKSLKELANRINLKDSVVFPGRFEGEALHPWYISSSIFILPSVSESFGAVINEALLSGCYVLSSKIAGGASLIKENITGNIFDPNKVEQISKILIETINKKDLIECQGKLRRSNMLISYDETIKKLLEQLS